MHLNVQQPHEAVLTPRYELVLAKLLVFGGLQHAAPLRLQSKYLSCGWALPMHSEESEGFATT